jgi:hypothetical protein
VHVCARDGSVEENNVSEASQQAAAHAGVALPVVLFDFISTL